MDRVIPRVGTEKRKSYIEMYAKPQRSVGGKGGYIQPKVIMRSGGMRGGFVSMGDRKVEGKKELSSAPSMTKRGGAELKVEKKEYQMPPPPRIIEAIRKKMEEEGARKKGMEAERADDGFVEEAKEKMPPLMQAEKETPKTSEGKKKKRRKRKVEAESEGLL